MTNLEKLEDAVKRMLEGEKKRRSIALEFIRQVESILVDVAPDIWGQGYDDLNAVYTQRRDEAGKTRKTSVYFRYDTHYGRDCMESEGFYFEEAGYMPVWGKPVEGYSGSSFWYCVQVIFEWLPILLEQMEKRSAGREKLLTLMNVEAAGCPESSPTA